MEGKLYANKMGYTDIEPYEVIERKTEKLYVVREMESTETNESKKRRIESFVPGGFFGHYDNDLQEWNIESKKNGFTLKIRKHKDGNFYDTNGRRYVINDKPIKFYDFNF